MRSRDAWKAPIGSTQTSACRRAALALLAATLLTACTSAAASHRAAGEDALRAATARYADLVLRMDSAGIAELFTADGEVSVGDQAPVRGREAIRVQLEGFKDYHVLAEHLSADTVTVDGPRGRVTGAYEQTVRLPSGDTVTVSGAYSADWLRDEQGAWRIARMHTTPHA